MINYHPKSSLFISTFCWFWLIVLLALLAIILVNPLNFAQIYGKPLEGTEKQNFIRYSETLTRVLDRDPDAFGRLEGQPRLIRNKYLYLYHPDLPKLNRPVPSHIDLSSLAKITEAEPQHIFSVHFHAIGPSQIQIKNDTYWLFEIHPESGLNLSGRIAIVPTWIKLLIVLLISSVLTFVFTRGLINPVISLRNCARQIAQGKFDVRHEGAKNRQDEIGQLSREFNNMAAKLEAMETSQKRLLRDISHELRSPLMRLNTANVIAQERANHDVSPYLNRIEQESSKLEMMISELLTLSRLESQQQPIEIEPIELTELLIPIIADATFHAEACDKTLICNHIPALSLELDKALMRRAIDNLLRNAIKYAYKQVTLSLKLTNNALTISISDDGQGVDESKLTRLVEPFYRIADSRERDSGGYGVGLAIANGAIKAHGGELHFRNTRTGGLIATVLIPQSV